MKLLFIFITILSSIEVKAQLNESVFIHTFDIAPVIKKNKQSLENYFLKSVEPTSQAIRSNVQGKVFIKFKIKKNGKIDNDSIMVLKGIGFGCDEKAIEIIQSLPKCNPALKNGKAISLFYTVPVIFKIP